MAGSIPPRAIKMKTLIIPDLHGGFYSMINLMESVGALQNGQRNKDWFVVQTGDAANCVFSSINDDEEMLVALPKYVDTYLIGNHEYGYFGSGFGGFYYHSPINAALQSMYRTGYLKAAHEVDGILITHAGLVESMDFSADEINEAWKSDPILPVFSTVGYSRGGHYPVGGILWSDHREPKNPSLRQIYGHTVGREVRRVDYPNGNYSICIDLGAGKHSNTIAGAVIDNGNVEIVYADYIENNMWKYF